jgi:hypothetical protein
MAWELIKTQRLINFEQEREVEYRDIAGEDGVVQKEEVLIQEGFKLSVDVNVYQDNYDEDGKDVTATNNEACVKVELIANSESTDNKYDISIWHNRADTSIDLAANYDDNYILAVTDIVTGTDTYSGTIQKNTGYVSREGRNATFTNIPAYQATTTILDTLEVGSGYYLYYPYNTPSFGYTTYGRIYFNSDGTGDVKIINDIKVSVKGIYGGIFGEGTSYTQIGASQDGWQTISLNPVDKSASILTADNFTDEENPTIAYGAPKEWKYDASNKAYPKFKDIYTESSTAYNLIINLKDSPIKVEACISFDGSTPAIDYREINITGGSYTFNLTEAEREALRVNAQGSSTVPIYFITKTTRNVSAVKDATVYKTNEIYDVVQRNFTVVGCNPSLNPTVKDIKPETLALTGDENTFVRYESMAEFAINATASKGATIVSQSVTCGSKTISNLPNGVIDDVESGTFIFNVTDSRSMGASSSVFKNLVEYVKPTCYQKVEIEISGETGANIKVTANGSYYNGSFGAADNTLKLEVRHTDGNDNWGEWQTLSGSPTFNGTTYELTATLTGFDYGNAYIFQCRATDKLNVVQSSQYTIRMMPVFDWSETDFNFNVPVNIDAEDLSMHGETIIRHSDTTNNTVLSASGGHVYIRPGGTDNTSGQTILYNNGNVDFSGSVDFHNTVNFDYSFTLGGNLLSDYVIETGSEAMGSNGTWYWQKWLSGKAEAWGCRNFGNMAVTTTWGNLYRSAIFTQDLPDGVFKRTPESININIVHGGMGGWICKHEQTAPSAVTTGSFIYVRPASATVTPTNIGFHIIGEWF